MGATRSGGGPDDGDTGTWATESLPLSVRKELLERELAKLGFRRNAAHASGARTEANASQQQDGGTGGSHPQADTPQGSSHGE